MNTIIKEISFNASLRYPLEYAEAMKEARKEASKIFKDNDAILILMKLLAGKNSNIILKCNDYSKKLKKDIEKLLNIK